MNEKEKHCRRIPERGEIGPRVNYLSRILRHRFNNVVNEEGLFSGQQDIFLFLTHNDGATISEIAGKLGVSNASASVSIKRMEKSGFIIKKPDEHDARITKLYLTEKGKAVPERIKEKMFIQDKNLTKGMTKDEILIFSDLLDKAINNLKEEK